MTSTLTLFVFGVGAVVGSFLNVVTYRLPRGESIILPGSRCPRCFTPIKLYDNIPLLSWVLLRGRCRFCREHISSRYPSVEAITGALAVLAVTQFGVTPVAFTAFTVTALLLVVAFVDFEHQIIPDEINATIFLCGLASIRVMPVTWQSAIIGATLGLALLGGLGIAYKALTGRDGMGGGDIKLAIALGVVLGWQGLLVTLFLASLIGTLVGVAVLLATRRSLRTPLPFGVFLALAAAFSLYCGKDVVHMYVTLTR